MLKKIIWIFLIARFVIAQDFNGIRIYINPGHGGYDSDDRYISATGFWESESNLKKGQHLNSILTSFGAVTKMSRTTNTTADDLPLSVITEDANNFDADYFQSIHSNGFNGQLNYTLLLWEGTTSNPKYPDAKIIGAYIAEEIFKAHRTTDYENYGEATFYGSPYLGLFADRLTMPGTLSEGSFHDYIPESWRLRNSAYLKHEAWAITKALIRFYGLDPLPYGEIVGILRNPFAVVNYFAFTADQKKPLNLVKATLVQGNKLYLGDALNNGFFMFDKVDPGEYQIILEAQDTNIDTISVSVEAGKTTFADKFMFAANQRTKLSLVKNYPFNNEINVSSTVKIKIQFDAAINVSTLGGNVFFQDSKGNDIQLKQFDEENYENGWIIFEPNMPLQNNEQYTVKILQNISDMDGLHPNNDVNINFTVEPPKTFDGNLVFDFENIDNFNQPIENEFTSGIDPGNTTFSLSNSRYVEGSSSGKLFYSFSNDSLGNCRILFNPDITLNNSVDEKFGMWIFGDFSSNYLEYWFKDDQENLVKIISDTLNWTGWRFIEVDLSNFTQLTSFNSLAIVQNKNGEKSGRLFFDNVLTNSVITKVEFENKSLSTEYTLEQNFPNPFNPATTILYTIPNINSDISQSNVTLKIYDILGKEIVTLVNKQQSAGNYKVNFDASELPSGVYFYQLKVVNASTGQHSGSAKSFIQTKKMSLLK
ncbi:MAG: N-acetylmuramoyl-L-alanine amidase [Ignavibacteriales bacterium]|nr:N-acetylmuramoyl-L-alanine amidase [Ignavibacteriales bacterium]MCB9218224.1 N-acetylmuramoyl-L-alanine amidase [Ignavibacteriales bacterium]MCB9260725.1 N-acetylmuramoyl-L-alanine amidase [Ignavibacteriales bacterium]